MGTVAVIFGIIKIKDVLLMSVLTIIFYALVGTVVIFTAIGMFTGILGFFGKASINVEYARFKKKYGGRVSPDDQHYIDQIEKRLNDKMHLEVPKTRMEISYILAMLRKKINGQTFPEWLK